MGDLDRALGAYERALIINSQSWAALTMAAHVCRCKEDYGRVSPVSNSSLSTFSFFLAFLLSRVMRVCTRAPPRAHSAELSSAALEAGYQ